MVPLAFDKIELVEHTPRTEERLGRVVHMLKFYPSLNPLVDRYQRPVSLGGLIGRELVDYLNTNTNLHFACEGARSSIIGLTCEGKRLITVQQQSAFKIVVMIDAQYTELNRHINGFLNAQYPIRKFVWVEVS